MKHDRTIVIAGENWTFVYCVGRRVEKLITRRPDMARSATTVIRSNATFLRFRRLKIAFWRLVFDNLLFSSRVQERGPRHSFFSKAFKALSFNGIDGDYAEFGSGGITFFLAAVESRRQGYPKRMLWAFDSFQGLPARESAFDDHPVWVEGALSTPVEQFHESCAMNGIQRQDYRVVPGFYEDTLTRLSPEDEPRDLALVYIDCDMYSSTKTVLDFLKPRLKHGMILAFDDYFCWSPTQVSGERRAVHEAFGEDSPWHLEPYVQFGWGGQSFVVYSNEALAGHA